MAGLFFCLASAEGVGLLFCPAAYSHIQAFTVRFAPSMKLYHQRHKTARRALQALFLQFVPLSRRRYQTDTRGYNTACTTLEHITAPQHLQHIPDTNAAPDAIQDSTADYYNKVYKSAPPVMDLCQTVQHIADHASPAGSAPTVCGSLASATPGAPAKEVSVSTYTRSARRQSRCFPRLALA